MSKELSSLVQRIGSGCIDEAICLLCHGVIIAIFVKKYVSKYIHKI